MGMSKENNNIFLTISRPSNAKLKKAGDFLLNNNQINDDFYNLINEWRSLHHIPLTRFRTNLHQYIKTNMFS